MLWEGFIRLVDTSYLPGPGAASLEAKGSLFDVDNMMFLEFRDCFTRLRLTLYCPGLCVRRGEERRGEEGLEV